MSGATAMMTDRMRADGWIEHDGGVCPVDPYSRPTIQFRDGMVMRCRIDAIRLKWRHDGSTDLDIIAYKPEHLP